MVGNSRVSPDCHATGIDQSIQPHHNHKMRPNRLSIPDARGHGASLRVTRHPEQRKIVLSHWRDGLCVASTPVELSEVPALIGVLADALGDAIETPDPNTRPDVSAQPDCHHPNVATAKVGHGRRAPPRSRTVRCPQARGAESSLARGVDADPDRRPGQRCMPLNSDDARSFVHQVMRSMRQA